MAAHLDHHERIVQVCLGVALEGSLQFSVNRLQRGRCQAKVNHAAAEALRKTSALTKRIRCFVGPFGGRTPSHVNLSARS